MSVLFLWLAGLAFIAHIAIPHDHFLTDYCSGSNEKHPSSESNTSHNSNNPYHCHSLNDIVSEKAVEYVIAKYIKYLNEVTFNFSDYSSLNTGQWCITLFEIRDQLPDPVLLTSSPFRAPPSFC